MKRTIFLRSFCFLSFLIYIFLISYSKNNFKIVYELWFSTALFFIANVLLLRSLLFRVNSSLWSSVVLYICFLTSVLGKVYKFTTIQYITGYLFSFCYASLVVFLFYRQRFHIKTFAFLLSLVLLFTMYSIGLIDIILLIIFLIIISILLSYWIFKTVKLNLRKV